VRKKLIISGVLSLLLGGAVLAQSLKPSGLHFVAPTTNGDPNTTVADPDIGEIIFDNVAKVFRGFNGATWSTLDNSGNVIPTGTILPFGGTTAPSGYAFCDGSAISRTTYAALFTEISTAYGAGDGSTTFNVPDLRGRFLRGVDGSAGNDPDKASRTAMASGGNTGNAVGSVQGQATKKNGLGVNDPGHTHKVGASTYNPPGQFANFGRNDVAASPDFGTSSTSFTGVTLSAGDNETRPVNANVNYIIKL
jgi:microcystin-dependent protein